jgi:Family of unknown function (DUF6279)
MTTTFNTMPPPVLRRTLVRLPIIAAAFVLIAALTGCGLALKFGYGQGSSLAFRWLDTYADFSEAQSRQVRGALDEWFAWNRRTQLPDYADSIALAEAELLSNTTAERVCAWADQIRSRVDTGIEHARPALVDVAATLTPQQIANVEKKFDERNESFRDDYLQRDPVKRRAAAVERDIGLAEQLYGSLDDAQREFVARRVAGSPFDAERSYAERLRRQQDVLSLLHRLAAAAPNRTDPDAEISAYLQRFDRSPDLDYRRYAQRLRDYGCASAAALHNGTSAEQRSVAVKTLRGYERELRELAAATAS